MVDHRSFCIWKDLLVQGLREDGWPWDWTTLGVDKGSPLRAQVVGKSEGVWAADPLLKAIPQLSESLKIHSRIQDQKQWKAGDVLLEIEGPAQELLAFERPLLNLASFVSGIATVTQKVVQLVREACPENPPRVALTRKTLPGYRDLSIHGVRMGGGYPHRVTLAGGVLIKENHIAAAGGIPQAIRGVREVAPHGLKIEIEVRNQQELTTAVNSGAEGVILDNFSASQVSLAIEYLKTVRQRPFVEVSGGLNESNISSYALPGVDVLSLGSLTHSVKSVDLSLLVEAR